MARMLGFIAEGCREIGRKANRLGLRRRLVAKDRDRQQALTRLGQAAWESKIDLSAFTELRSRLEQLDARAGDLSATARQLDAERADLLARRQAEVNRFDALLAPAKAALSEADTALRTARSALAEKDGALRAIETQLAGLGKELARPDERLVPAPQGTAGGAGTPSSDAERRDRIGAQQKALAEKAAAEAAARGRLADDVDARTAESRRRTAETGRLDAERKAALKPIDAELERLRQVSAAATQERATVGSDQKDGFRDLGAALYERRTGDPALAERVQAVAAVDADRAATQAAIDGSLGLTKAMPRGTMAKFGTVVLLVLVLLIAAGLGLRGWLGSSGAPGNAAVAPTRTQTANAPGVAVAADERRKDEAVLAYMKARDNPSRRKEGIEILAADVTALGSAANRSSLPLMLTILERGEPELRAAAAHAVGMIGPTPAEVPALMKALNDPMPAVREAVLLVLDHVSDPRARLLVQRVRSGTLERPRSGSDGFTPTVAPDAARLGIPVYPGATFLAYASDLEIGRASFSSADPVQKVVDYYAAAARRPPVGGTEFSRLYFGGTASDPSGADAMNAQREAWLKQAVAAGMPQAEMQAEYERRVQQMTSLPFYRYVDASLYGEPAFIATELAVSEGAPRVVRYVVVFQDLSLGRTGIEHHVPAEAIRR